MNKSELIVEIVDKTGFSKQNAETFLRAFFDTVEETLLKGEKINLSGYGTYEVRDRKGRRGTNPKTGESIDIPAYKLPSFKFGRTFREKFKDEDR